MFAKTIIDSDAFLEMPMSARLLYYDLAMRADDDGFINSPKKIMKFVGATNDDMNILILRKFIIPFDNGIVVIKHWRIHNYIRKDTYNETSYKEQKALLELDENKAYKLSEDESVDGSLTQVRLGKVSIDKDNINIICSEPKEELASEPAVITLTLNDKSEYLIYQKDIDEWKELYPSVDVIQQLRNMKGWCNSNPSKRKTRRGIKRFINSWLSKEQDKPKRYDNNSFMANSTNDYENKKQEWE